MFGTIRRYHEEMGAEDRARLGRKLANCVSDVPGFVACVVLEDAGGECVSIELWEDQSGQQAAEALLAREPFAAGTTITSSGEAIFQQGL